MYTGRVFIDQEGGEHLVFSQMINDADGGVYVSFDNMSFFLLENILERGWTLSE